MITSPQQKNRVQANIDSLNARLEAPAKPGVPPHLLAVEAAQINEDIALLEAEIEEYDAACCTPLHDYTFSNYQDFLKFPIVIRLARDMSQQAFADYVGISLSQLKRYEAHEYQNASTQVVNTVLERFQLNYQGKVSEVG
ncbi:helix-turn-helix domain-containing protein [Aurantivibrio plasticivorans]